MKKTACMVLAAFVAASFMVISFAPPSHAGEGGRIVVFHAGSLSVPFKMISDAFEKENPGVEVSLEAAGSRTCARKITDLGRCADVLASADYTVIDELLIPDHADWNIWFATNEMAIMYRPDSKGAGRINGTNWPNILLDGGASYGRSDPDSDPCGYRTLMVWRLSEEHYGIAGLFDRLMDGCPQSNIRPKETDLISMLEAGQLDYLFIYKSVCVQHGMPFVELPQEVSLCCPEHADFYGKASVEVSGKSPGQSVVKRGEPMVYGVTIPKCAHSPALATRFVAFLLGERGRKIMEKSGQGVLDPPRATGNLEKLPPELAGIVNKPI